MSHFFVSSAVDYLCIIITTCIIYEGCNVLMPLFLFVVYFVFIILFVVVKYLQVLFLYDCASVCCVEEEHQAFKQLALPVRVLPSALSITACLQSLLQGIACKTFTLLGLSTYNSFYYSKAYAPIM